MAILGTTDDDTLTGNGNNNLFDVSQGGNDTVSGLGGDDVTNFGDTFNANDHVDGGSGTDTVELGGDSYADGLTLGPNTLTSVERLVLDAGHTYNITTVDGNVAADGILEIDARLVGSMPDQPGYLIFDGSAETDGAFRVLGSTLSDTITTGSGNDIIDVSAGEGFVKDVHTNAGNDTIRAGNQFDTDDTFDGGTGSDTLVMSGMGTTTGDSIFFTAPNFVSIETLQLTDGGHDFDFIAQDDAVANGARLTVDASDLHSVNLVFDGQDETDGSFRFIGGHVDARGAAPNQDPPPDITDVFIGGSNDDIFHLHRDSFVTGNGGADFFTLKGGVVNFNYNTVSDSTSESMDRIRFVNFDNDSFTAPWGSVTSITEVSGGKLSRSHFDTQLSDNIGDALGSHGAVVFDPSGGGLANHSYLVIDCNGVAGYQAGADIVVDVSGYIGLEGPPT